VRLKNGFMRGLLAEHPAQTPMVVRARIRLQRADIGQPLEQSRQSAQGALFEIAHSFPGQSLNLLGHHNTKFTVDSPRCAVFPEFRNLDDQSNIEENRRHRAESP